MRSIFASASIR